MSKEQDRARTLEAVIARIRARTKLIDDPQTRAVINALLDLLGDEL